MSLELCGEIEKAHECFSKAKPSDMEPHTMLAIARMYYLWDYYMEGLKIIQPIFKDYYRLKDIDVHILIVNNYPTYDQTFGYLTVFAKLSDRPDIAFSELENAKKTCFFMILLGLRII
ncbi:MAG: hypothetical protein ACFFAS_10865 [Promethearchaeota archaeon]